jgi:hypothetical protein
MKKDATIRARVPRHIADMIGSENLKTGRCGADFVRTAVLEKLAKDRKTTVEAILKGA